MERPLSDRGEFRKWQQRLKRFEASGLSIDAFCQQEAVLVATAKPELLDLPQALETERIYCAQRSYATGVEEGLEHFGVLDGTTLC